MKISAIILAAGESKRMGSLNKLLLPIHEEPIIKIVCKNVIKAKLDQVILVTGYQSSEIKKVVPNKINQLIYNSQWKSGMMSSISAGMSKLDDDIDGNLIILGDMPLISTKIIKLIKGEFQKYSGEHIVYPKFGNKQANPVIFPKKYFCEISNLRGDKGCKKVLKQYSKDSICIEFQSNEVIVDFDTRDDYYSFEKRKFNNVQT